MTTSTTVDSHNSYVEESCKQHNKFYNIVDPQKRRCAPLHLLPLINNFYANTVPGFVNIVTLVEFAAALPLFTGRTTHTITAQYCVAPVPLDTNVACLVFLYLLYYEPYPDMRAKHANLVLHYIFTLFTDKKIEAAIGVSLAPATITVPVFLRAWLFICERALGSTIAPRNVDRPGVGALQLKVTLSKPGYIWLHQSGLASTNSYVYPPPAPAERSFAQSCISLAYTAAQGARDAQPILSFTSAPLSTDYVRLLQRHTALRNLHITPGSVPTWHLSVPTEHFRVPTGHFSVPTEHPTVPVRQKYTLRICRPYLLLHVAYPRENPALRHSIPLRVFFFSEPGDSFYTVAGVLEYHNNDDALLHFAVYTPLSQSSVPISSSIQIPMHEMLLRPSFEYIFVLHLQRCSGIDNDVCPASDLQTHFS